MEILMNLIPLFLLNVIDDGFAPLVYLIIY
jgi:hypothetical protein